MIKKIFLIIYMMCVVITINGCSKGTEENKNSSMHMDEKIKVDSKSKSGKEEITSNIDKGQTENVKDIVYNFEYNPYVLSKDFLIKYGKGYVEFYKNFVDAYINYETSCPCPKEEYSYEVEFLTESNFLLFNVDVLPDYESIKYDKKTKTIHWKYESNTKIEHDNKIEEFENQVASYMRCLQKGDTDFEKAIAIYGEFNSRMKYDKNVDDTSAYHALMIGTGKCTSFSAAYCHLLLQAGVDAITNGGFSKKSGGHRWNIVHLYGKDYFMDPTYEVGSKGSDGKGLLYFGMSKKEREEIGGFNLGTSQYGDVNGLEVEEYLDSDDRFSLFRSCIDYKLDRKHKCIVYYNKNDNKPKKFYYEK